MTTVISGQTLDITIGQSVSGILVLGGGTLDVLSGASVSNTTLASQGEAYIYVGGTATGTIIHGGFEFNYGTSSNAVVDAGAQVAYGLTAGTTLSGTGLQQVFTGGTATGTTINSGGEQMVGFGGASVGTIINAGGMQSVMLTGIAHDDIVNNGGIESLGNGGTAAGITIQSGGCVDVAAGTVTGSVVDNGIMTFDAGSTFSGELGGSGSLVVSSGTMLLGGVNSFAGNVSIGEATFELGGAGAAGSATIGFAGPNGVLQIDGTSMPTNVILGFALGDIVDLAGIAFDNNGTVQLTAGNLLQISENGHLYQLQLDSSASFAGVSFSFFGDAASGTYLTLGQQPVSDAMTVTSGQSASNLLIMPTGTLTVASGGSATATMVEPGGSVTIDAGGNAHDTTINGTGFETVFGSATGTTLRDGAEQDVHGTAANTTIDAWSAQQILSGGAASGATVNANGTQIVTAGAAASATLVNQDGSQYVQQGGTADGSTLMSGSLEYVESGATTTNTIIDGGMLDLAAGAVASGTITFLGSGGTLFIENTSVAYNSFGAVIDSFSQGNIIDLSGAGFAAGGTVQLLAGNILQVVENSVIYSLQLDPTASFSGDYFKLGSDSGTGSEVYIDRAPTVTVANVSMNLGQTSIAATALFTAADADGDTMVTYAFNNTGSGHFALNGVAQASGQEIDVTASQLSQLTYQDSQGGAADTLQVRVSDGTLWSNWANFTVTPALLAIESFGSTRLDQAGNHYSFDPVGGGAGPQLKYGGAAVTVGQFGTYAPIGAEAITVNGAVTGYEVAWKDSVSGQYIVWDTDSNGNYANHVLSGVSGASAALQSIETSFHQDLNSDGTIGVVVTTTAIESSGSTRLDQVGNSYSFDPVGGGAGPQLKYGGAAVTVGQFGTYAPIGAEAITVNGAVTGYEIAWKDSVSGQYIVWDTDNTGNYTNHVLSGVSGASTALQSIETSFHQDLNGDGTIGVVVTTTAIESSGSTRLDQVGNSYSFDPVGGGAGPQLKYGGAAVTVGQFGTYAPIGAEAITANGAVTGYEVAWKDSVSGQYIVWDTDSNGNYANHVLSGVSGASAALQSIETSFHQDLNGDGTIGVVVTTTAIESSGSTRLDQVGNSYSFDPVGGGAGPQLKYGGAAVTVGQFGTYAPIGAEAITANGAVTGYEVAWKDSVSGQYIVWDTDSNGNYTNHVLSGVSGASAALQSIETSFHQDLNGDGTIGVVVTTTAIELSGSTRLDQVGNSYFFDPVGGGAGPQLKYGGAAVTVGQFGTYAPIGAEAITVNGAITGYEIAWKDSVSGQYIVWDTDSNGNYTNHVLSGVSGASTALQSIETSFHQDLNGDSVIGIFVSPGATLQVGTAVSGSATIGAGATLDLAASDSGSVTFAAATGALVLETPSTFSGTIFNFTGNGSLSGSDHIDLKGMNFGSLQDGYANGVLTVSDGVHTASLNFSGSYSLANFKFSDDGHGGTLVIDPPAQAASSSTDSFTFPAGSVAAVQHELNATVADIFHWPAQTLSVGIENEIPAVTDTHLVELHANGFIVH